MEHVWTDAREGWCRSDPDAELDTEEMLYPIALIACVLLN
jgi:hypothetical protein